MSALVIFQRRFGPDFKNFRDIIRAKLARVSLVAQKAFEKQ